MKEYFAYIRVSTRRQGEKGVSLQEQRDAIERYAAREGLAICEWFEERETAAKRGRTVFTAMVRRLRKAEARGVLIHKIDRSARNLRDWSDLGDLIDAGIDVRFATESLDLATRGGRLSADIQAVVAADYIRNLREEARKGFYGRLKQGVYPLAAPIGYLDQGGGRLKIPDPERAALVREAFRLYATGEYSLTSLRRELHKRGLTSRSGKPLSRASLSRALNNPFYAGVLRIAVTGETFPGAHEPLISPSLFKAVQAQLRGRTAKKERLHAFDYKKLLTCRACGRLLTGERQKGFVYYRCHNPACAGTCLREETVDAAVREKLAPLSLSREEAAILREELDAFRNEQAERHQDILRRLDLRLAAAKDRLGRMTDLFIDGALPRDVFQTRRETLLLEIAGIEKEREQAEADPSYESASLERMFELATSAQQSLESADPQEKRDLIRETCSNLVTDRKTVAVELYPAFSVIAERPRCSSSGVDRSHFRTLVREVADIIVVMVLEARRTGKASRHDNAQNNLEVAVG